MVNILLGTPGPDTFDGDIDAPDSIIAGGGNDLVNGNGAGALSGATDQLFGEGGDDTLVTSSSGSGALDGGDGNDSIVAGAPGIDTGVGGAGNDTLVGDAGTDYLTGDDYDIFGAPPSASTGNDVIDSGGGDDQISGGPGDDILSPGAATRFPGVANLGGGYDRVLGGDGNDTLALAGAPQDYGIVLAPVAGVAFVVSNTTTGPGSNVNAIVEDVERIAFGVTAEQLAAGAVPLTTLDYFDLFDGSANSGTGRAHLSLSDTVLGAYGAQQVAISIADLLANDFDPDGDILTFVALNATATTGINTFLVFTDPTDIANEGYDPADFPEGLLLAFLDNPLTAPLSFTYRTEMQANGSVETGSTATVTINPGPPPPPPAAVNDALRGTIGGTDYLLVSVLLGNDLAPLTFTGLDGMTPLAGSPGVSLLSTFDPLTGIRDGFLRVEIDSSDPTLSNIFYSGFDANFTFTYLAEDASGNSFSATVTVTVDNEKPVAANQSVTVTPGVATRIQWADIVNGAGNLDPDGDPLTLASYTFLDPALGTLQGFGPVNQFDPNDFGSIEVTLNPGVTGASIQYGILDVPDLGGARSDILNIARATLNFVVTAAPPLFIEGTAGADTLTGTPGPDSMRGFDGDDFLVGLGADDLLEGGAGNDTAVFDAATGTLRIRNVGGGTLTVEGGALGTDTLVSIESIRTQDGTVNLQADLTGLFSTSIAGDNYLLLGRAYVGPVMGLERELFGSDANEVFSGTSGNDFMNLFGGDDTANGGAGDDVIDGGLGSNLLSGGAGKDTFFLDGRGGGMTWTTIADWEAGEQLSVWGWRPGTSRVTWVDSDGVGNFTGVTMHGDLNGDGVVETSVTWAGMTRPGLPTPLEFDGLLWFIG